MKVKHLWIPFAVFFALTVPLRVYQVLELINPTTGFFPEGDFTLPLLLSLLAVFVLVLIVMCGFCKNVPNEYRIQKNIFAGVTACLAGALLLTDAASQLVHFVLAKGNFQMLAVSIASVLAGAALITIGVCTFLGKNIFDRVPLFSLVTSLWCCVRLVTTFLNYTNYATTSNNMFDILGIVFLLLFFFTQAKLFAGLGDDKIVKRLFLFGLSAIVFVFVFNLPVILQDFLRVSSFNLTNLLPRLVDLALVFYILGMLIEMTGPYSRVTAPQKQQPYSSLEDPEISEHAIGKNEAALPEDKPLFFQSLVQEQQPEKMPQSKTDPVPRMQKAVRPTEEKSGSRKKDALDMEHIDQLIEDICKDEEILNMLDKNK